MLALLGSEPREVGVAVELKRVGVEQETEVERSGRGKRE
jgi:hypothetical protein